MEFIKAQGLGNDFVILVNVDVLPSELSDLSRKLADRRYGIGCDQVIVAQETEGVTKVRFFNSDGSEAESCGNGTRCIAKYLMQQRNLQSITLETMGGRLNCRLEGGDMVSVEMPKPIIEVFDGPQGLGHLSTPDAVAVTVGNPHLVCFVDEVDLVERYGEGLENHPSFPLRTNVDFVKIIDSTHLQLKVWERGTGVTPACGSGACAAMVAAYTHKKVAQKAKVTQSGGDLWISFDGNQLFMTGPAILVFSGEIAV
jgi:diaminopimelate epimerase